MLNETSGCWIENFTERAGIVLDEKSINELIEKFINEPVKVEENG